MEIYDKALVILRMVSIQTGVSLVDLTGKRRHKTIMKAKWIARDQLKKNTDLSNSEIMILTGSSDKNKRVVRTNTNKTK